MASWSSYRLIEVWFEAESLVGAIGTAVGAEVRSEAFQGQQRIKSPGDALHRGITGVQVFLGKMALIIAAHSRTQKEMGCIEQAGRRPFVLQGEIGINEELETIVEDVGLLQPIYEAILFSVGFLLFVFEIGDECLVSIAL